MRLKWFQKINPTKQIFVLIAAILILLAVYLSLSKYIQSTVISAIAPPLQLGEGVSAQAKQFLKFRDLSEENKKLQAQINEISAQLVQFEELKLENQRLRKLLSLSQERPWRTVAALVIGKDSSNWTKTIIINKGTKDAIKQGMPVILGASLVGRVIEVAPYASKVSLIIDFNSKVPALIQRTREQGLVFGALKKGSNICRMKYIQGEINEGDTVISSGLGELYPKGLLIGKIVSVEEEENRLYKIADVRPEADFFSLEEVMVITGQ